MWRHCRRDVGHAFPIPWFQRLGSRGLGGPEGLPRMTGGDMNGRELVRVLEGKPLLPLPSLLGVRRRELDPVCCYVITRQLSQLPSVSHLFTGSPSQAELFSDILCNRGAGHVHIVLLFPISDSYPSTELLGQSKAHPRGANRCSFPSTIYSVALGIESFPTCSNEARLRGETAFHSPLTNQSAGLALQTPITRPTGGCKSIGVVFHGAPTTGPVHEHIHEVEAAMTSE